MLVTLSDSSVEPTTMSFTSLHPLAVFCDDQLVQCRALLLQVGMELPIIIEICLEHVTAQSLRMERMRAVVYEVHTDLYDPILVSIDVP